MLKLLRSRRKGFTLTELVLVLVVVGVLASLAVAYNVGVIDKNKIAEAKTILWNGYAGYQRLLFDNEPIGGGNPLLWPRMGMVDPNTITGRLFDYSIRPNPNAPTALRATFIKDNTKYVEVALSDGALTVVNF